jgi:hypothetical protein
VDQVILYIYILFIYVVLIIIGIWNNIATLVKNCYILVGLVTHLFAFSSVFSFRLWMMMFAIISIIVS